jgi:hypothetical protein
MNEKMAKRLKEVGGKDALNDFLAEMSLGENDEELLSSLGRATSGIETVRS